MQVQFQRRKNPLEEEMTTHSRILAWEILWTEEPGGLQSMGLQRVTAQDCGTEHAHALIPCMKQVLRKQLLSIPFP